MKTSFSVGIATAILAALFTGSPISAQPARAPRGPGGGPQVISPAVSPEGKVTFRILAPNARNVRVGGSDIPGLGQAAAMTKETNGVWEVTLGPLPPGAYRYNYNVDDVPVIDPRNPQTSESNENTWSLLHVAGAKFMDLQDVPHGAVAEVLYPSKTLGRTRRMHIYTPPRYEAGKGEFPVFYLLHGAFDSDDSWSSVGRAGIILDNLIAEQKARPMIVVMPAGHTGPFRFGTGFGDEFERDFVNDVVPYVEKHYRVAPGRNNRALAGLSMGGAQTLNIAMTQLEKFAYLGVFSSGVFGLGGPGAGAGPGWEEKHKATLDNADLKKELKLVWFATGKDDFLLKTSQATVEMLKKHQFDVVYKETEGAHTWTVWREYLNEFAPQLFR